MKNKILTLPAFFLFILGFSLIADATLAKEEVTWSKNDFVWGAKIQEGSGSLRRVELTQTILRGIRRDDWGDVRIFNQRGQVIPFEIKQKNKNGSRSHFSELTHYPLKLSEPDSVSGVEVEIEESKDTTKVSVRTQKESTSDSEASNSDGRVHIIENPSPELWLVALRLEWSAAENRIWALSVETSDDLQNWRMHKARVFIAKMSHQGSRLERKSITLLPTRARYLRLSWLDEAIGGTITSIAGEYTSTKPLRKNWTQIPKPTFDAAAKEVLFSTQGPFPVRDIEFIFRKDGILLDGQLFSRQTNDAEWRRITHIQQYRLAATDSQIIATPLQIATSRDREWKIALTQPAHLADDEVPDIKIGWSPVVIDFVAQGQGPYILAYGNPQAKPVSGDLSALRGDITPEDVEIISVSELGGEQILEEKTSETQWKKILLWLVLVASVVFMGRMAFVLYREIA